MTEVTGVAVIELGDRTGPAVDDDSGRRGPPARRPVLLAGVLVLLLVGLTGGAPLARPLPEAILSARLGTQVIIADDRLYLADPITNDPTIVRVPEIAVHALPDGRPLGRTRLSVPFDRPTQFLDRVGDILLFTSWQSNPQQVAAVRGSTGATRWQRIARFEGITAAGDALLGSPLSPPGSPSEADPLRYGENLRAVDPVTGNERWLIEYPPGTVRGARVDRDTGRVSLLADLLPAGRLRLLDPSTGRVIRTVDLSARTDPAGSAPPVPVALRMIDDLVLIDRDDGELVAYEVDRLNRRWSVPAPIDRASLGDACVTVLCRSGPRGGTDVLDPATGRVLWRSGRWNVYAEHAGRLVAAADDEGRWDFSPVGILDPRTGRLLADLGPWWVMGPVRDGEPVYGLRFGRDGRALVAELLPARGSVRVLGGIRDVSGDCRSRDRVLICRRVDGRLAIWNLAR
ncbi:PQQ-binding-like beta-propeller repeat protein [Plantactinospora sp. GCM10030261]|uniref:outer membrane protein assembly factor BamB family protein n=1 Tax=Plantactinospora sp. GCM10030261 TaxID=3273420 RepID=UPI00361A489F